MSRRKRVAEERSPTEDPRDIEIRLYRDHVWPTAIVIALLFVVLVNLVFIYIAVSDADPVVPSYSAESR